MTPTPATWSATATAAANAEAECASRDPWAALRRMRLIAEECDAAQAEHAEHEAEIERRESLRGDL